LMGTITEDRLVTARRHAPDAPEVAVEVALIAEPDSKNGLGD
jgi:hypothetical protein